MKKIPSKLNILGTEYSIEVREFEEDKVLKENSFAGYCCGDSHLIVISNIDNNENFEHDSELAKENYINTVLRHEIIHAFLNESGLQCCAIKSEDAWSRNEEMVDWIAIQFPKILKVYQECGVV